MDIPITQRGAPGASAGVCIVPSIFGINPDLERRMEELASSCGALVTAFDSFWRGGGGPVPYSGFERAMARARALDHQLAFGDAIRVFNWTREKLAAGAPLVGVGICYGGPFVLVANADGHLDGGVTWHGSMLQAVLGRAAEMSAPMSLHFGAADRFVPPAVVDAVRAAFDGRADVEIVVHPGADHGFSHPAGSAYHPEAARSAMSAVVGLVDRLRAG